jgi:hypothetical protein
MYYQINNGQAVEATLPNTSNPQTWIAAQSQKWRHERGIYSRMIEGDVTAPTADHTQDAIIVPRVVAQTSLESEPTPALYPDGIETPVIVLTSQASGFGIGVIATDEGEIATYIDHQSPRPDKAEIKRRMTAALTAKREQSAAYLALLDALENGNTAGVKAAAKAARQKHRKGTP